LCERKILNLQKNILVVQNENEKINTEIIQRLKQRFEFDLLKESCYGIMDEKNMGC
jgi:hypothetical protein